MPISMEVLLWDINRKLLPDGLKLRKSRSSRTIKQRGEYYAVNLKSNDMFASDIDVESWGRLLGILSDNRSESGALVTHSMVTPFQHLLPFDALSHRHSDRQPDNALFPDTR